jgi:hypothetical protein
MRLAAWPITFLLVFALLVQNTCLHGFAGKTSFAGKCSHCPSKARTIASPDAKKVLVPANPAPIIHPMYVFNVSKTSPPVPLQRLRTARPSLGIGYKDALPDDLLKPPRA